MEWDEQHPSVHLLFIALLIDQSIEQHEFPSQYYSHAALFRELSRMTHYITSISIIPFTLYILSLMVSGPTQTIPTGVILLDYNCTTI